MIINKLNISNLRNLKRVELLPHPSVNIIYGANGAGKTSILESLTVLSRGRSFRGNRIAKVIGPVSDRLNVFAEIEKQATGLKQKAVAIRQGLERSAKDWTARRDGQDLKQLSELAEALAVVVMEPNSHLLVSGPPEVRRRYLDWGVFHVEPGYLQSWRRYSRALKQRNAALRSGQIEALGGLDRVFIEAGQEMSRLRSHYVESLSGHIRQLMKGLSPELGEVTVDYRKGWVAEGLEQALEDQRQTDLERGTTHSGPHRADLGLRVAGNIIRDSASRGEQKILSIALVLAQASRLCESGTRPLLLLDDLASEFDRNHFTSTLEAGLELGIQIWITGVEAFDPGTPHSRFHVEHGKVRKMV